MTAILGTPPFVLLLPLGHHHCHHLNGLYFKWHCVFGSFFRDSKPQTEAQKLDLYVCTLSPRSHLRENNRCLGLPIMGNSAFATSYAMKNALKFRMVFECETKKVTYVHISLLKSLFLYVVKFSIIDCIFFIYLRTPLSCSTLYLTYQKLLLSLVNNLISLLKTLLTIRSLLFQYCLHYTMR